MNKQKFKKGDKLVMVRDGQHWAAFRKGDKVVFVEYDKFTESKIVVKGSWEGNHNIIQIISIDDVALITKTKTPCEAIAALDEMESAEPLFTVLMPDPLEEHTS